MVDGAPAVSTQIAPDELTAVLDILQFGWMMAEYHGRYSVWNRQPGTRMWSESPQLPPHALPLTDERSAYEGAIQIEGILVTLAEKASLDFLYADVCDPSSTDRARVCEQLVALRKQLLPQRDDNLEQTGSIAHNGAATWDSFFSLLHDWDSKIQDTLAAQSLNQAGAYQLGRGLAEIWWAGPQDTQNAGEYPWTWLLGQERSSALDLRLGRLNQYFGPDLAAAMRASLSAWMQVAVSEVDRQWPDTMSQLEKQVRIWRDLLLNNYDPENLLNFNTLVASYNRFKFRRIAMVFLPELLVTGVSLIVLVPAITWFVSSGANAPILAPIFSVLGLFGLSFAAVTARAKSTANDLAAHLRQTLHRELLAYQITVLPAREKVNQQTENRNDRSRTTAAMLWQGLKKR